MTILWDRPWPTVCLSVSATNVVLPKLLSQSFNLLTPEKRDTRLGIFHCSSLGLPPISPFLFLCPCNVLFSKAQSYPLSSPSIPPLFLFSFSSLRVLCRIPICLSGDTNWKIAWGFPWAATPTDFLLISGKLRKLVKRVVTDSIFFCPSVPLSHNLSWWPLERHGQGEISCSVRMELGFDNTTSVLQHVNSLAGAILSILCKCLEVAMLNLWRRAGSVSCSAWIQDDVSLAYHPSIINHLRRHTLRVCVET